MVKSKIEGIKRAGGLVILKWFFEECEYEGVNQFYEELYSLYKSLAAGVNSNGKYIVTVKIKRQNTSDAPSFLRVSEFKKGSEKLAVFRDTDTFDESGVYLEKTPRKYDKTKKKSIKEG